MSINRYTRLTPAKFDPYTFQELMAVPAYKRKQHDDLDASIAEIEGKLANVDPLDIHTDLAKQEQERLYNDLLSQRDKLSSEGFNARNRGDFLKLNKDYQQTIGPMGTIGKINQAKKIYNQQKKDALTNLTKLGYSPEDVMRNWDNHSNKYKQGFDGSNISNIDGLYAGKYLNHIDETRKFMKETGMDAKTLYNNLGTSKIEFDKENGLYYVKTKKGHSKYKNNNRQLQQVLDFMNDRIANPESDLRQSLDFQGVDPERALDDVMNMAGIYRKDAQDKAYGETISSLNRIDDGRGSRGRSPKTVPDNTTSSKGDQSAYFGEKATAKDVTNKIDELRANGKEAEAREVEQAYERVERQYRKDNPWYQDYKKNLDDLVKPLQGETNNRLLGAAGQSEKYTNNFTSENLIDAVGYNGWFSARSFGRDNPFIQKREDRNGNVTYDIISNEKGVVGKGISKEVIEKAGEMYNHKKRYEEGLDKQIQHYNKQNINFKLNDLKSADRTTINKDIHDAIKLGRTNEFKISGGQLFDPESDKSENIQGYGGGIFPWSDNPIDLENAKDQKQLMNMISSGKAKVQFLSYNSENKNGLPSVKIEVIPDKDSDKYGGKTIQLDVEMDNFNNPGTSVPALETNFLSKMAKHGGRSGQALAHRGAQRLQYKDIYPTFNSDFRLTDKIKSKIKNPYIMDKLKDKDLDINLVDGKYVLDVGDKGSRQSIQNGGEYKAQSFGWTDLLGEVDNTDTKESLKNLSPRLAKKLVQDIKQWYDVETLEDLTEEQVDEGIKNLAKEGVPITTDNYYDLLDIITNTKR